MTPDPPPTTSGHIIITPQSANLAGFFNTETPTGTTETQDDE